MNPKRFEKWGHTREGGRKRFILLNGMCGFGLCWGVAMALLYGFHLIPGGTEGTGFDGSRFLIYLPAGLAAGALWGWWMWRHMEQAYRKASFGGRERSES